MGSEMCIRDRVAGGVKLDEPAIDLAIAVSIASSFKDAAPHLSLIHI
ncbi:hypothetical protein H8I15_18595 [Bacillus pumilus]|nr:hypothetical protein [Bacillus pumilus]